MFEPAPVPAVTFVLALNVCAVGALTATVGIVKYALPVFEILIADILPVELACALAAPPTPVLLLMVIVALAVYPDPDVRTTPVERAAELLILALIEAVADPVSSDDLNGRLELNTTLLSNLETDINDEFEVSAVPDTEVSD